MTADNVLAVLSVAFRAAGRHASKAVPQPSGFLIIKKPNGLPAAEVCGEEMHRAILH